MGDLSTQTYIRSTQAGMYPRSPYGSASPPAATFVNDMYSRSRANGGSQANARAMGLPSLATSTSDPAAFGQLGRPAPTIMIRRLPRTIRHDALEGMLIFAGDLIDVDLVPSPYAEDHGYATAVARFHSQAGALEAQQKLNGKPNTTKEANMVVEVHSSGMAGSFERRNTIDGTASRSQASSASSGSSFSGPSGKSRFNGSFQPSDKVSPPLPTPSSGGSGEFPVPETSAHFQNLFSPQSPLINGVNDPHRVSGKSMINDDSADDETGELLKDPVAYAKSGQQSGTRRATNPQIPVSRFSSLALTPGPTSSTGVPTSNGLTSPRNAASLQSPPSSVTPTAVPSMSPHGAFAANYPRPQYPPVNPADQNPPCNTLYVGNLPIDTSEDELKALFSKQRGYKRLCFRTKQNGPMCFVEFEDVSFATKTLNELYGAPLHNSVKGGIRLSFSKNPLGVRSGQANGLGPNAAMTPQAMAPGYAGMMAGDGGFSSVSGPPPGLAAPPGLISANIHRSPPPPPATGMDSMFSNPFGMPPHAQEFANPFGGPRALSGGVPGSMGSATFGRDSRGSYSHYMLGR